MQKKFIYILLLISLLSLTFSCQTDRFEFEQDSSSVIELADGRLRVPILLQIPEREVVETKTTPSGAEKTVKTVDVCVFDADGNILEKVKGEIDPTNSLRVFAKVLPRNVACKVQIYVNIPAECRAGFENATSLKDVQALTMSKTIFEQQNITDSGLPLVSDLKEYTALNNTTLTGQVALLKFAYARIDITNLVTGFTLASCQGLNFRQNSYLTEQTPLVSPEGVFKPGATTLLSGIYLFESPGSTPTDLLIKGTNTGFGEGYYKIRIAYGDDKKTYDIRRGVCYAVKLTSVKGPGYASADEAIANEPCNVEVDITVDDGISKNVVISNGKYYLGVSNSEFIVCADIAHGVTATTLSHNAPGSVKTAIIKVVGTGITLSANQPNLTVSSDGKSATINLQTPKVPIRVDLSSTAQPGTLTIRIGDLVKTISIKKIAKVEDTGGTKSLSDLGLVNSSIVTMNSLSPRITVGQDKSLVVAKAENSKYDAYSYAEAFSAGQQEIIRIAVKQTIQNVVYYEQYADQSYGFYFGDNTSTLSEDKTIKETGYGVLGTREDITTIKLGSGVEFQPTKRVIAGLPDCSLVLYSRSHKDIVPVNHTNAVGVFINGAEVTANYIYPNFAKVISTSSAISTGTQGYIPFSIRTPKQFRNINLIASIDGGARCYRQERDLNFADMNIGGDTSFPNAIIENSFCGNYDGAGKRLENLTLNNTAKSMALFCTNAGEIKDMRMYNINVAGGSNSACLAGINKGTIRKIYIESSKVIGYNRFIGGITGHNSLNGFIENCMIVKNIATEDHFVYSHWITDNDLLIGAVAGCNHIDSKGISSVIVLDLDSNITSSFIGAKNTNGIYIGGIVGKNSKALNKALYIARPILLNGRYFPISGFNSGNFIPQNAFFLRDASLSNLIGGGSAKSTTEFSLMSVSLPWIKVQNYPYPHPETFPVPKSWPVKN